MSVDANAIIKRLGGGLVEVTSKSLKNAGAIARRAADASVREMFSYGAKNAMNRSTPPNWVPDWQPLAPSTIARKGHARFFFFTGDLRQDFGQVNALEVFGETKVSQDVKTSTITVRIMPDAPWDDPDDRNWVEHLHGYLDDTSIEKLLNGNRPAYRPVVQPLAAYFAQSKVKRAVNAALREKGYIK